MIIVLKPNTSDKDIARVEHQIKTKRSGYSHCPWTGDDYHRVYRRYDPPGCTSF